MARIEEDLAVLKRMAGFNLAIGIALLFKAFTQPHQRKVGITSCANRRNPSRSYG